MAFYNNALLELEYVIDVYILSYIVYILPQPIKFIQNLLIQDKIFIIASSQTPHN
jgi:hypothetical protein